VRVEDGLLYGGGYDLKLLFLFGDAAVGKMTVGQELMKITDLRLFHNHMTIEPVIEIFGQHRRNTTQRLCEVIFEDFAVSDCYGMIFTFMWAFDCQADWDYIAHVGDIFKKQNADIYYIELVAPQEIRLQRNATENRLKNKPSKRDIEISNQRLLIDDHKHRCVSNDGEITFENYIKIDNTDLAPDTAAKMIKEHFSL
jgi:hypothetical protein